MRWQWLPLHDERAQLERGACGQARRTLRACGPAEMAGEAALKWHMPQEKDNEETNQPCYSTSTSWRLRAYWVRKKELAFEAQQWPVACRAAASLNIWLTVKTPAALSPHDVRQSARKGLSSAFKPVRCRE
jgi:hypothetical protein